MAAAACLQRVLRLLKQLSILLETCFVFLWNRVVAEPDDVASAASDTR